MSKHESCLLAVVFLWVHMQLEAVSLAAKEGGRDCGEEIDGSGEHRERAPANLRLGPLGPLGPRSCLPRQMSLPHLDGSSRRYDVGARWAAEPAISS